MSKLTRTTEMFPCEVCGKPFERLHPKQCGPWTRDEPGTVCSLECAEKPDRTCSHYTRNLRCTAPATHFNRFGLNRCSAHA